MDKAEVPEANATAARSPNERALSMSFPSVMMHKNSPMHVRNDIRRKEFTLKPSKQYQFPPIKISESVNY